MKTLERALAVGGIAAALLIGSSQVNAQNQPRGEGGGQRGNFDPAQMRQRMMERMREQLGVTDDDEWKIVSERIEKVTEARRGTGGGFGAFGRGGRPPGGGAGQNSGQGGGRGGRGFGPQPSPEEEALQKAIDDNAAPDVLKDKLAKVREARKASEATLKAAQNELKEVLNGKQEAVAVLMGLLP
jgi:hypothetical protein